MRPRERILLGDIGKVFLQKLRLERHPEGKTRDSLAEKKRTVRNHFFLKAYLVSVPGENTGNHVYICLQY